MKMDSTKRLFFQLSHLFFSLSSKRNEKNGVSGDDANEEEK